MGHHGGHVVAEQAKPAVTLAVEFCVGAKLGHPCDLARVLREMTLRRYVIFGGQLAQALHVFVAGAGGEARGQHRAHRACVQAAFGAAGVQPAARFGQARGGARLTVGVGAVAVHGQLANKGRQARVFQLVHQFQRGVGVQRGKDARAGRGTVFQIAHKVGVTQLGVLWVGVVGFLGVGVLLQPVQQFQVHGRAAIAVLRRVQVQVDQARRDDAAGVVKDFHPGGRGAAEPSAQAVLAQQIALAHAQCVGGGGVYKGAFQGETIHRNDLSI